ncbi:MAG: AAA family ATPase, partial [Clostridia bacterium]|nr:AAA family ATPase [Clostridia bacterium]
MKRMIATGIQDFEKLRVSGSFYVDKTDFIREWWKGCDDVTLIARPRG